MHFLKTLLVVLEYHCNILSWLCKSLAFVATTTMTAKKPHIRLVHSSLTPAVQSYKRTDERNVINFYLVGCRCLFPGCAVPLAGGTTVQHILRRQAVPSQRLKKIHQPFCTPKMTCSTGSTLSVNFVYSFLESFTLNDQARRQL